MLKISKPLGSQKVSEYYKFEHTAADQSYYAEGKQLVGEWHGRLAAEFELAAVEEESYHRLATGQHPSTGEQLIKHRPAAEGTHQKHSEHVAAWDWTLAPHKSYSVTALVGGVRLATTFGPLRHFILAHA